MTIQEFLERSIDDVATDWTEASSTVLLEDVYRGRNYKVEISGRYTLTISDPSLPGRPYRESATQAIIIAKALRSVLTGSDQLLAV